MLRAVISSLMRALPYLAITLAALAACVGCSSVLGLDERSVAPDGSVDTGSPETSSPETSTDSAIVDATDSGPDLALSDTAPSTALVCDAIERGSYDESSFARANPGAIRGFVRGRNNAGAIRFGLAWQGIAASVQRYVGSELLDASGTSVLSIPGNSGRYVFDTGLGGDAVRLTHLAPFSPTPGAPLQGAAFAVLTKSSLGTLRQFVVNADSMGATGVRGGVPMELLRITGQLGGVTQVEGWYPALSPVSWVSLIQVSQSTLEAFSATGARVGIDPGANGLALLPVGGGAIVGVQMHANVGGAVAVARLNDGKSRLFLYQYVLGSPVSKIQLTRQVDIAASTPVGDLNGAGNMVRIFGGDGTTPLTVIVATMNATGEAVVTFYDQDLNARTSDRFPGNKPLNLDVGSRYVVFTVGNTTGSVAYGIPLTGGRPLFSTRRLPPEAIALSNDGLDLSTPGVAAAMTVGLEGGTNRMTWYGLQCR